jgi:acetyl-CoA C-acetyltransferase
LTNGAAALRVSTTDGLRRLLPSAPRVRLIDVEIAAMEFRTDGLPIAPAFALPRLLARHGLAYEHIDSWEIHEPSPDKCRSTSRRWKTKHS